MPKRGTRAENGYGYEHQRMRRLWAARVAEGTVACARCGGPILPGMKWDLGHDDFDRSRYQGPEHSRCNRHAGAVKGAAIRNHDASRNRALRSLP